MPNIEKCDVGALCKDRGCPVHDPDPTPPQEKCAHEYEIPVTFKGKDYSRCIKCGQGGEVTSLPPTEGGWEETIKLEGFYFYSNKNRQKEMVDFIRTLLTKEIAEAYKAGYEGGGRTAKEEVAREIVEGLKKDYDPRDEEYIMYIIKRIEGLKID